MHRGYIHIAFIALVVSVSVSCFAQDTTKAKFTYEWSNTEDMTFYGGAPSALLFHMAEKSDRKMYRRHKKLIKKEPDEKNFIKYYNLALSLWNLDSIHGAEKMMLKIESSTLKQYVSTYRLNSDVPGDTTSNNYGYGSCDFSYKNEACLCLARIYLEKKEFEKAYKYAVLADSTYKVAYTCGTGNALYQSELEGLYSACYEGMGKYRDMFKILMPYWYSYNPNLTAAIKKTFKEDEIKKYLDTAKSTLAFKLDTFQSTQYCYYGKNLEHVDTVTFTSGSATMRLFGYDVTFPAENLKNGEVASKDYFLKFLLHNDFYRELKKGE